MATRRMPDHIADHVVDLCMGDAQKIKPQIARLVREYGPVSIEVRNTYEAIYQTMTGDDYVAIYQTMTGDDYVRLTLTHIQHAFLDGAVGDALVIIEDYTQTEDGQAFIKAGIDVPIIHHNPLDMKNYDAHGCCGICMMSNGTKVLACPTCGERVLLT